MKRGKRTSVAKATKATQVVEEVPEPVKIPMAVHISGLQRPWSEDDLKEKLLSFANSEITDFRVNGTKSECIVTLDETAGAEKIRDALHEKPWHDKPGAKPVSVEIVAPNFEFAAPVVPETNAMDVSEPLKSESATEAPKSLGVDTDSDDKAEAAGTLYTTTLPALAFRPRSEEQVAHMRKRRNYELDSTTLNGRFYSDKKRKRRHGQMAAASPAPGDSADSSGAPSSTTGSSSTANRDHSRDQSYSRRNDRYDRGGDRYDRGGSYDRRDSRHDYYDRRDSYSRGGDRY